MKGDDQLSEAELLRVMSNALDLGLCVSCRVRPLRAPHPGIRFCAVCTEGKGFHPTEPGILYPDG